MSNESKRILQVWLLLIIALISTLVLAACNEHSYRAQEDQAILSGIERIIRTIQEQNDANTISASEAAEMAQKPMEILVVALGAGFVLVLAALVAFGWFTYRVATAPHQQQFQPPPPMFQVPVSDMLRIETPQGYFWVIPEPNESRRVYIDRVKQEAKRLDGHVEGPRLLT